METLRIRKLAARYHLPKSAAAERERLDRVLHDLLGDALDTALERAGVSRSEEICLRTLAVPVRLRLSQTDAGLVAAWSAALADAIRRTAQEGASPDIVLYTSRMQAFVDMAISIIRGDLTRAWSWRQLGIWRSPDGSEGDAGLNELVRALLEEPTAIVPLLCALASPPVPSETLARLAERLLPDHWVRLASAAVETAGGTRALLSQAEPGTFEVSRSARRLIERSALYAVLRPDATHEWRIRLLSDALVRRAIAVLIIIESDPATLRANARSTRVITGAVADALYPQAAAVVSAAPIVPESRPEDSGNEMPRLQQRAFTRYGGLLFLLHLVIELALPDEMVDHPILSPRGLRWSMHRLALTFLPSAEPDDPAVLAFAGLMPDGIPPSRGETPPNDAENEALSLLARRIGAALERRLPRQEEPLLSLLCRQAEIVADPGWIDVCLSLSDVSTAVRRAALDLDLGYLPWLGTVVRFVYE